MAKNINIAIVHYNTPTLTRCLIKSIEKFTPGCKIYVFDNSDTLPFNSAGLDNVIVFDNTKGQIINFDRWLENYPKRFSSNGKVNKWGSAKHCVSVEKCMSLIKENFILMDSDVLLKKDLSDLFDPGCIYVGEVVTQPRSTIKRVLPYICFINVEQCLKNRIHYFDENRMHGLCCNKINKAADSYDTGAGFFIQCGNLRKREIKTEDYVVHYSGASWQEEKEKKYKHAFTPKQWLNRYGKLWKSDEEYEMTRNKKVIYTCVTGNYEPLDDPFAISDGYDYVCFTNSNIKSDVWEIRPIPEELRVFTEVKKQRCIKINPHKYLPEYELSIWVDGSIKLLKDVNSFVEKKCSGDSSIFIPRHPQRNCIYDEMTACIKQKKDTEENIAPQRKRYKEEKFPENYGLVQSNIIVRKHNDAGCIKLMDCWWNELKNGSHRDQLSFNYAMWKNSDVPVTYLDKTTCNSEYFRWDSSHGKRKPKPQQQPEAEKKRAKTAVNIDEIMKSHHEGNATESKGTNKIQRITTQNPIIRRQLISRSLKEFLKP